MTKTVQPCVPKRVLHIGKYFPPHRGGMETVLRDQMNMQTRDEGLQVAAVVHSSERRLTDKIDEQPLGYRVRFAARWFTAVFAPISPFFAWSIHREIKKLDPDEIRLHMPNVSAFWLLCLPAAWRRSWTILWHSDVLPSEHSVGLRVFYWAYRPFESMLLRLSDKIIATSPPYLASSATLRRFREKCIVEPLKLDRGRIATDKLRATGTRDTADSSLKVLCVGRLTYYKNFTAAVRAIAAIPGAELRIVGDGEKRLEIINLIKDLDVSERVSLMTNVRDSELWGHYQWCDLHCLPSNERTEAFGLSITEAGLFGKPSVVYDVVGSGVAWNAMQSSPDSEIARALNVSELGRAILRCAQKTGAGQFIRDKSSIR